MKILVFSDSHLTDRFDEKKFRFLQSIITPVDQVIICGDFWDGYLTTFDQFITSPWKSLFPLLKSKKTVYIYGNHDKDIFSHQKVNIFSHLQTHFYKIKVNKRQFIFEHGHHLYPALDDQLNIKVPFWLQKSIAVIQDFLIKRYGKPFLKLAFKHINDKMKKRMKTTVGSDQYFITGHTHFAEVDNKNRYANPGVLRGGLGQYLFIDEHKIILREINYE